VNGYLQVFDDVTTLNEAVAHQWQSIAESAVRDRGAFHVALAGGGTPRKLYERLTQPEHRNGLPWDLTHVYFGDERCVPQDHADSNYRMASNALLSHASIPPSQIHAMFNPSLSAKENADHYAGLLADHLPTSASGQPMFDLILLGMGDDGHTASLFPGTEILHETNRAVAAQFVHKLDAWRISLTFPTINAARNIAILVAGVGKADRMAEIYGNDTSTSSYPIQRVNPTGRLDWYLDRDAAQHITHEASV
jgi:6-phosphogluconolactonase